MNKNAAYFWFLIKSRKLVKTNQNVIWFRLNMNNGEKQRIRLKDIAEYTGFSISTISRVLTNKDRVHHDVRAQVQDALKQLGYIPNEVARSLRNQGIRAIGIIVPNISNPFYAKLIYGIEQIAYDAGFYTVVCNSDDKYEREYNYLRMLISMQISGLVIATRSTDYQFETKLNINGIPIVFVDNIPEWNTPNSWIGINNKKTAELLTNYLIQQGHRDIGIAGGINPHTMKSRLQGWKTAMKNAKLKIRKEWMLNADYNGQGCHNAIEQLFKTHKKMPTAFLATNNFIAHSLIGAMRNKSLEIPKDVSVVCFDAEDDSGLIEPKLTGISQPAHKMGKKAAQIILRLNNESNGSFQPEHILLDVDWIDGNSVRKLKRNLTTCNP